MKHGTVPTWCPGLAFLAVFLALPPGPSPGGFAGPGGPGAPRAGQEADGPFVCPPCGAECHAQTYEARGSCSVCGMALVPESSVPRVAVLLFEGVDVPTSTGPLGIFASSEGARVYTVADTTDPIRCQDSLVLVPEYAIGDAPWPDVLVLPSGWSPVWEDELLMRWITRAAEGADHVLGIGLGALVVARTGLLTRNEVASTDYVARRGPEVLSDVRFLSDAAIVEDGPFVTARDAGAATRASLEILAAIGGEARARDTARELGLELSFKD